MHNQQNHLIELLPRSERLRFLGICEPFQLQQAEVLCEPGTHTRHVYFPTAGRISLTTPLEGHPALEVGMVGHEGMVGVQVALGLGNSPLRALVQGAGSSWRIDTDSFRIELARNATLTHALNRYLFVLMAQLATSAACLRFHQIGPRVARWLLMSHDRAHSDAFHVTQESLACTLGVRRVGITEAACELQRNGLIEYNRGEFRVLDRAGLEAASCCCYVTDQQTYAQSL